MAWIKSFKNSSGGFDSFDWSLKDSFNVSVLGLAGQIIGLSLFSLLVPFISLMLYSWSIPRHRRGQAISGVIAVVFCILDYQFGLMAWWLLWAWPETYSMFIYINCTIGLIHILTLIIDKPLYEFLWATRIPILGWAGICIYGIYKTYPLLSDVYSKILTIATDSIWLLLK